ncbi:LpqB family beta-propeller domain-containing protein [Actinomadura atramentaria]|uniref:LpqB family beta-propeller domain-containing protein n=1 Tax=Actinomadura atramentaria TaxID=1990 RepID=UPI0003A09E06|nr:LpqB family beta-propeller domain-containing protein [Actinomadura atramentaria]
MRCTRGVVAAVLLAVALTGCASVPSGGRVVTGRPAEPAEQVDDPYVRLIPVSPRPEWSPTQLVAGFLAASASFDDGHKVAREYLTGAASSWNPGPRPPVAVFADRPRLEIVAQTATQATVKASGSRLGSIGADGQYTADPKAAEVTFDVVKTAQGPWRIAGLPGDPNNGLILTKSDVDRAFRTVNLYFFAPDGGTLVPNGIFLPLVNRQNLPGQLVRALLAGPTSWLGPAVDSAFPRGTRLRGLRIEDDTAVVDLSVEARSGDVDRMSAQLSWTLRQLSEITRWKLEIAGDTATPHRYGSVQPVRAWDGNAPDGPAVPDQPAYVLGSSGRLSRLAGDQPQPVLPQAAQVVRPAVSGDYKEVAGLSPAGDRVLLRDLAGNSGFRTVLKRHGAGTRFTAPSFDRSGALWTVETGKERSWLWVRPRGGPAFRVSDWGLSGREVVAFRLARDGVRAAVIVKADGRAQLRLGRIVRDQGSSGLEAGAFLAVSSELVDAIDLAWRDYGTLAVLGRKGNDTRVLPYLIPVGGGAISSLGVGALGVPKTIAAAPGAPVLIGTKDEGPGQVCRQRAPHDLISEWICPVPGSDPMYPR